MTTVLLVDDDAGIRVAMGTALRRGGVEIVAAASLEEAKGILDKRSFDAVVLDYQLGDGSGLDLLRWIRGRRPESRCVLITAFASIPLAVDSMRDGASHFLAKPVDAETLLRVLREICPVESGSSESKELPSWMVARSPRFRECVDRLRCAARVSTPVLLTGPTGAGKELLARFVHESSPRRAGPFLTVNCAAVASTLFESEFFGHVRGAYTGAGETRSGLFREAHRGTLLLDEVTEIPLELQTKLLRIVEEGEVRAVGGARSEKVDVRIVASTNRDPHREMREGRLREDFYYRLAGVRIQVPPLADRPEDVTALAAHFLAMYSGLYGRKIEGFSAEAMKALQGHRWPGNVRELRNAVERGVISCSGGRILSADLALEGAAEPGCAGSLEEVERRHILEMLEECGGDRKEAARRLRISKSTLRRKLIQYGNWSQCEPAGSF